MSSDVQIPNQGGSAGEDIGISQMNVLVCGLWKNVADLKSGMDDIPERVVSMCFWAIRDEGTVDEEMVNVILAQEGLLLRESRRTDLTNLLCHFHRFHFATEAPADRQSAHDPTDAALEHVNHVLGMKLRNRQ